MRRWIGMFVLASSLFSALPSFARPMKVDDKAAVEKLLKSDPPYMPLRAGWNGPELKKNADYNITFERYGPQSTRARIRRELISAAVPGWNLIAAIAVVILLLRIVVHRRREDTVIEMPLPRTENKLPRAA